MQDYHTHDLAKKARVEKHAARHEEISNTPYATLRESCTQESKQPKHYAGLAKCEQSARSVIACKVYIIVARAVGSFTFLGYANA